MIIKVGDFVWLPREHAYGNVTAVWDAWFYQVQLESGAYVDPCHRGDLEVLEEAAD